LWNALLPTQENTLLITASLTYNWLHLHFALGAAPGFSVMNPAVLVPVRAGKKPNFCLREY
jgi:hypothetical protein